MKTGRPDASSWARELSIEDRRSFGDLARRLAGGAPAMPWWAQSHDRVIKSFLDEPVPERPVDIETRTCTTVGDEFYARLNSGDTGLVPAQWLRALCPEAWQVPEALSAETAGFLLEAGGRASTRPRRRYGVLLPAALAAPALEAARAEAANPVTDNHGPGNEDGDGAPFRRKEL